VLDDKTSIVLSNNEIKYRQHLGIIRPRTPTFPEWASKEIKDILKGTDYVIVSFMIII